MTKLMAMKMMPVDSLNLCENVYHVCLKMIITYNNFKIGNLG